MSTEPSTLPSTSSSSTDPSAARGKVQSLSALRPFLRPYRLQIALALLFLVLAAATTLVFPVALRHLVDGGAAALAVPGTTPDATPAATLRRHFLALFGVAVALGLFSALRYYTVTWLGERITTDLRQAVYQHVIRLSPSFFESTRTGEVLSRLTTDTTLVQSVVGSSLSMGLRNLVMALGALGMLVWTSPGVMLQVLAILLLVIAPVMVFGRRVRRLSRASQDRVADTSAIAGEVIGAIAVVQAYTAEAHESHRFDEAAAHGFATAMRRSRARAVLVAFVIIATSAALLWGLFQGTQAVLAGRLSAGELGQTVVYVIILAGSAAVLGEVYGELLRAAGATERLVELLHSRSPVADEAVALPDAAPTVRTIPESHEDHPADGPAGGASLCFENVGFSYPSRPGTPALRDFNLRVRAGETVALVGASGAGKSTVLQLLLRFHDPAHGRIAVDGIDLRQQPMHALRRRMALVPQDGVIFSGSVADNIRYGSPAASPAQIEAAARAAHAHGFIEALPEGYATPLGERGVRLSGGQRQRIAIARAMLRDAPILLLDEATSALDAESERMVQAALAAAMRQRTTLVIAHRLATVVQADRIVVMDQGRIVEQGSHAELLAAGGTYARLAALQFSAPASA
ncbi:MAG: ABC transporter transmembrane domain-containing protein [Comamonas sp.]